MNLTKKLSLATVLIVSATLLVGCTDPAVKTEDPGDPIQLNARNKKVLTNTKVENNLGTTDTQITNKESNAMPEITYKELSDFKEIEATQAVFETTKGLVVISKVAAPSHMFPSAST